MNNNELIKKLKDIRTGQPNPEWVKRNRDLLLSQIKAQQSSQFEMFSKDGISYSWQITKLLFPRRLALQAVTAVLLVFILVLGTSVTTAWADRSLPGEILYPIKITSEKVQLTLATSSEDKAKLQMEFAGKRLDEVKRLSAREDGANSKTTKQIEKTLESYKKNIASADDHLVDMVASQAAVEADKVVSLVNDQLQEYSEVLASSELEVDNESQEAVAAAVDISEQLITKNTEIVLRRYQAGSSAVSYEGIKDLINGKIADASERLGLLEAGYNQAIELRELALVAAAGAGESAPAPQLPELASWNELSSQLEAAREMLRNAGQYVENGEVVVSFEKVKEVDQIIERWQSTINEAADIYQKVIVSQPVKEPTVEGEEVIPDGTAGEAPNNEGNIEN